MCDIEKSGLTLLVLTLIQCDDGDQKERQGDGRAERLVRGCRRRRWVTCPSRGC